MPQADKTCTFYHPSCDNHGCDKCSIKHDTKGSKAQEPKREYRIGWSRRVDVKMIFRR